MRFCRVKLVLEINLSVGESLNFIRDVLIINNSMKFNFNDPEIH